MESGRERGEAAAQGKACFARFPGEPERADFEVQVLDGGALTSTGVSFAAKNSVQKQRFGKAVFEIPVEGCGAALNAAIDIFVEHQSFQSE
jgi:hypothetical protein